MHKFVNEGCFYPLKDRVTVHVVCSDDDFLVIYKPSKMHSAPLKNMGSHKNHLDAFSKIANEYPEILKINSQNPIEGGLIHRIDYETSGLLLIARTQHAYDNFYSQQKLGHFIKYYYAETYAKFVQPIPFLISSYFRPYGKNRKKVEPVFENASFYAKKKAGTKQYTTEIIFAKKHMKQDNFFCTQIICKIREGYRHQVRAHLASIKCPIINDPLYAPSIDNNEEKMRFFAIGLEFLHPKSQKVMQVFISDNE